MAGGVLVVDDEALVALDLSFWVLNSGCELCGTALSGAQALAVAQTTPPAVALIDITMPGTLSGIETARQLHRQFGTRIVFVAAHPPDAAAAETDFPYDGVLQKPISEPALRATLRGLSGLKNVPTNGNAAEKG